MIAKNVMEPNWPEQTLEHSRAQSSAEIPLRLMRALTLGSIKPYLEPKKSHFLMNYLEDLTLHFNGTVMLVNLFSPSHCNIVYIDRLRSLGVAQVQHASFWSNNRVWPTWLKSHCTLPGPCSHPRCDKKQEPRKKPLCFWCESRQTCARRNFNLWGLLGLDFASSFSRSCCWCFLELLSPGDRVAFVNVWSVSFRWKGEKRAIF